MSHFAVAVFHREDQYIDDQLAPYDENIEVEPYIEYTRDQAIKYAREHYNSAKDMTDEECFQYIAEDFDHVDDDGNIYSTYNPDSKWDWWEVGGRWSGMQTLKDSGELTDSAKMKELVFEPDHEAYKRALRFWDVVVDHKPLNEGESEDDYWTVYKPEYFLDYYGNRETYARHMSEFRTYAVITPDGKWYAPGDMGYFGFSSESGNESRDWNDHYRERFIDTADPDLVLTVVDCHI